MVNVQYGTVAWNEKLMTYRNSKMGHLFTQ